MTDNKKRPTRRNVRSELDDLRSEAGADGDDITVTISHVDVPPADDEDDGADDAMVLHRRWSTDPDVEGFDVDPDDVRDAINDEDDGGIPAGEPTHD